MSVNVVSGGGLSSPDRRKRRSWALAEILVGAGAGAGVEEGAGTEEGAGVEEGAALATSGAE